MSDSESFHDRYLALINQIIQMTLKGNIRSKEQVYQLLVEGIHPGTGELFERVLGDQLAALKRQIEIQTDELKQAKATRSLRALQTIQSEWERWQDQNQALDALNAAAQQVIEAKPGNYLSVLLQVLDSNRNPALNLSQMAHLAKQLSNSRDADSETQAELQALAQGIVQGLEDWKHLEANLVSWIYDQSKSQIGFEAASGQRGPWAVWAKQVNSPLPQQLFQTLALEQSVVDWMAQQSSFQTAELIELVVVLRCLQQGLVNWFDKLVYDSKVGAKLSISVFLAFAVIWSQLATGLARMALLSPSKSQLLTDACFQVTLQILRAFAQQSYFPLYGGIFASFSGQYLRDALTYLDEPLKRAEGTQEKARILTLLGSSFRAQGDLERAIAFHQQAQEIAREAGDRLCEIASLNHLSRTYVAQRQYAEAINHSQRALILSRQRGDRLGEANALANLGFSEVFQAQQLEADPDVYEAAINYLQQGLQLAERLGDRQSQALCMSSLGVAYVVLEEFQEAIPFLEGGIQAAQFSGDLYLQGFNLAFLAEAHYRLKNYPQTMYAGCLGMYLLEQIASTSWRQPAGLLMVLQGELGDSVFQTLLMEQRPKLIVMIGIDGYDHLPDLLKQYRGS